MEFESLKTASGLVPTIPVRNIGFDIIQMLREEINVNTELCFDLNIFEYDRIKGIVFKFLDKGIFKYKASGYILRSICDVFDMTQEEFQNDRKDFIADTIARLIYFSSLYKKEDYLIKLSLMGYTGYGASKRPITWIVYALFVYLVYIKDETFNPYEIEAGFEYLYGLRLKDVDVNIRVLSYLDNVGNSSNEEIERKLSNIYASSVSVDNNSPKASYFIWNPILFRRFIPTQFTDRLERLLSDLGTDSIELRTIMNTPSYLIYFTTDRKLRSFNCNVFDDYKGRNIPKEVLYARYPTGCTELDDYIFNMFCSDAALIAEKVGPKFLESKNVDACSSSYIANFLGNTGLNNNVTRNKILGNFKAILINISKKFVQTYDKYIELLGVDEAKKYLKHNGLMQYPMYAEYVLKTYGEVLIHGIIDLNLRETDLVDYALKEIPITGVDKVNPRRIVFNHDSLYCLDYGFITELDYRAISSINTNNLMGYYDEPVDLHDSLLKFVSKGVYYTLIDYFGFKNIPDGYYDYDYSNINTLNKNTEIVYNLINNRYDESVYSDLFNRYVKAVVDNKYDMYKCNKIISKNNSTKSIVNGLLSKLKINN